MPREKLTSAQLRARGDRHATKRLRSEQGEPGMIRRLSTDPLPIEDHLFSNRLREMVATFGHVSWVHETSGIARFRLDRFLHGEGRLRTDELDRLAVIFGLMPTIERNEINDQYRQK